MSLVITRGFGSSGGVAPTTVSVTAAPFQVIIVMNTDVALTGDSLVPGNWSIVADDDASVVPVSAASAAGTTITLTTGETGSTRTYVLTFPAGVLNTGGGGLIIPGTQAGFTGLGVPPTLSKATAVDSRTLEVIFSEAVNVTDALTLGHYSIPGLTLSAVVQITSTVYRLTTSTMVAGNLYTLTASNIKDAVGNPM